MVNMEIGVPSNQNIVNNRFQGLMSQRIFRIFYLKNMKNQTLIWYKDYVKGKMV